MEKIKIGAKTFLYPMPTTLVGANVVGKPNFLTIAYCGIVQHNPAMIAVTLGKAHYTNAGIKENKTFSVNIPSEEMVVITDYCGIVSGKNVDKSILFTTFYGELKTAPMIRECPINLECRVIHILDLGSHSLVIGRIEESYTSDDCLTEGKPDINKIQPLAWVRQPLRQYRAIGEVVANSHSVGRELKA